MKILNDSPIETLWNGYRELVVPANAPAVQVEETHRAFFGGAAALFELVVSMMDSDREPTKLDLQNMDKVANELTKFGLALDAEAFRTGVANATRRPS